MLTNKKAVIFDLDGTLVDSMWIWKEIDIRFLGAYGLKVRKDSMICWKALASMKLLGILKNIFRFH